MTTRLNFTKANIETLALPAEGKRQVVHDTKSGGWFYG
jgi:hypothetical protein